MNRLLFSILLLSVACSKGDSKSSATTPTSDTVVDQGATGENDTTEASEVAGPEDAAEPATAGTGDGGTNLQVLPKQWSKTEVKGFMKQVTKGLGVQCSHCHDPANYASDNIPAKLAARKMIEMTRMLDQNHFGGKGRLKCITCHKGALEP